MKKHILLAITGGIAAYKSCELVRRLQEHGCSVRVMMSDSAAQFVSALTFQALSGNEVRDDLFGREAEHAMSHIELARWADAIIIAPASANYLAKLNHGFADCLISTVCLATSAPIFICPAMNQQMWNNPATKTNAQGLMAKGYQLIGPASGSQACGEVGPGRMIDVAAIIDVVLPANPLLKGKKVLITAGPTREAIDPVRYLSNHSSGKMGYALAQAAMEQGGSVVLISGPTQLDKPQNCHCVDVMTASQMQQAVSDNLTDVDVMIACAAVCDYRVSQPASQKIKKEATDNLSLELIKNPDIVAEAAKHLPKGFVVGFAAETDNLLQNAKKKLKHKQLDMVVANQVGKGLAFDVDDNAVSVITREGQFNLEKASKHRIARQLMSLIAQQIQ